MNLFIQVVLDSISPELNAKKSTNYSMSKNKSPTDKSFTLFFIITVNTINQIIGMFKVFGYYVRSKL